MKIDKSWNVELEGSEANGGGYIFNGATDLEFLGGGEISFRDFGGVFHRTTLPYLVTKVSDLPEEYQPDPRDEEPWSDTQTRIEQMNSIKGR